MVVFALAELQGLDAAIAYADKRLGELAVSHPQFYLDPVTGGPNPGTTLAKARNAVFLRKQGASAQK